MNSRKVGFVFLAVAVMAASLHAAIPAAQRQALIDLYNATGGASWTDSTGWKTPPLAGDGFALPGTENDWYGVTTDPGDTIVTAINLASNNLIGTLPASIGNITSLTGLNLANNQISGTIPTTIGNLTGLLLLHLYQNDLTGSIPTELGNLTNCTVIDLYENQLTGSIPTTLGGLTSLQYLRMHVNSLSGSLPTELGSLTNLLYLNCYHNSLTGSIPASFGGLTNLQSLRMHENLLTGSLPTELGNLTNLTEIYLNDNDLSGVIPDSIGNLTLLTLIRLEDNALTGSIPTTIGNLTNLVMLSLHHNSLSGTIPTTIGNLVNLTDLYIQFNALTGAIPAEIGNLTNLVSFYMHENLLDGAIPTGMGNLTQLVTLYMQNNRLQGTIPTTFGNLTLLTMLRLDGNRLYGSIPTEIGNLTALTDLRLATNRLSGTIPASIGNLVNLQYLHLFGNAILGPVPASITALTALLPDGLGLNVNYNLLYTSDPVVSAFLVSKDADWTATQTVAPTGVAATPLSDASILISWIPIEYDEGEGHYIVSSSTAAGGPYTLVGETATKTASTYMVGGLTPGVTYYFVVRTHTDHHTANLNAVESENSPAVSATAQTQTAVVITGRVTSGGLPLAGVVMTGLTGSPVTNALGVYAGTEAIGWSGTVTPTLAGYTFTPAFLAYETVTVDRTEQDYTAAGAPGSITVTAPNGGESWALGSTHDIAWTTGLTGTLTIDLYKGGVYLKTLGTADAGAGMFSWSIARTETPGTDYRVLVWQGAVSDESAADFALVRTIKVDFNNDGQEDLLWRYQGAGAYQGMNCIWLLNYTSGLGAQPLASALEGLVSAAPARDAQAGLSPEAQVDIMNVRVRASVRSSMTPMRTEDMGVLSQGKITGSPMDLDRDWPRRAGETPSFVFRTTKDSANLLAADDGQAGIASLTPIGFQYPQAVTDLGWEIAGAGDFDRDGDTDILWRNYSTGAFAGFNCIWYMNASGGVVGYSYPDRVTDVDWRIEATGDFNRDGYADIVWRRYGSGPIAGYNCIWYMGASGVTGYSYPDAVVDLAWKIVGAGDFNGDGYTDLLWRNYGPGVLAGFNGLWYLGASGVIGYGYPWRVLDLDWHIDGTGDFNKDGYADIVWRYYGSGGIQGMNCVWYLQGDGMIGADYPMSATDTNWKIGNR